MKRSINNLFLRKSLSSRTAKNNYGLQIGIGNISTHNSGIQIGMFNTGGFLHNSGIQIGMFNTGGFLQLGLLNYNPRSYIPYLPLVNWDMGREE